MILLRLFLDLLDDKLKRNFQLIQDLINNDSLLRGQFKFMEIVVPSAAANLKILHGLGYTPKDIIMTSAIGSGSVTWNYSLFSDTQLDLTTTGAVTIRCFVGRYI